MNTLPIAAVLATDAVRRQFAVTEPPVPEPEPVVSRARLALALALQRAAHAVAPARYRPAH